MRPRVQTIGAGAVVLALSAGGCVDQRADVAAYRGLSGSAIPAEDAQTPETLSLTEALRRTLAVNERLSIEGESYLQALIDRQRTAASVLPTLDAFGNLTFRDRTGGGSDMPENAGSAGQSRLFDGGLRGQYTLLTGLSDFNSIKATGLNIEQRHWLVLDLRETLTLETGRAYYAVLLAERLVDVLESSLAVQEERLRDIRGRQEVGFARPLDVAQIEAQTSETRVSLLDARNQAATARSALTLLTGLEAGGIRLSDGFDPPADAPTAESLMLLAETGRQDLAAAAAAAGASRARVDAEIGRYFPTITVNLDYFLTRDTAPSERDWQGLLTIHLPIFSAGQIEADVRAAWSSFREDVLRHSLTRREIRRDVEVSHSDLLAARARVIEVERQLRAAGEALRQAEASYGAGLATNLERVTAQDQLLAAQVRLAREEFSQKVAYLAAMRAAGVLSQTAAGTVIDPATLPPRRAAPESPFVTLPGKPGERGAGTGLKVSVQDED